MNVQQIQMPIDQAKEAYKVYRQAVRDNPDNKQDQAIMLKAWEGAGEPAGWMRHPDSGRRRPDGDPAKEYVHL